MIHLRACSGSCPADVSTNVLCTTQANPYAVASANSGRVGLETFKFPLGPADLLAANRCISPSGLAAPQRHCLRPPFRSVQTGEPGIQWRFELAALHWAGTHSRPDFLSV